MFTRSIFIVDLVTIALFSPVLFNSQVASAADALDAKDYEFSATATIASDYMFRGVSQTLEDPTVQASFDFSHVSGLSAGVWSSNVDFQDRGVSDDQADQEIDIYLGYGIDINQDWSVDATAIRYILPGTASDADLDWNELLASVNFRDRVSFMVGYSNKVFNIDETGIYYALSGNLPLAYDVVLTASVGYYDLDEALNDSYLDFSLGAEISSGIFTSRIAYIDTNGAGSDLFGDIADSRIVFSVTATMGN
ncbi:TorF family putative porin [Paraglaciecola arctica]|uniref:TIGR02001 family outer membrane protein n=1 Tax=Paraglaciecola arctica BSs20135 TaxID=493475 RepID=K6YZV1_9ALTE|nr:TorF family putative porin [Paraglaciecola arctica]GAC22278.1 hypothetical protein GARC_5343 [Paraglaciecola arctica BSs20135]